MKNTKLKFSEYMQNISRSNICFKKTGDTFATVYFCDMFMSTIEVDEQFTSLASQQQY